MTPPKGQSVSDWSQGSAYPFVRASSDGRVSDHDSVTESRWSEVYRLLPAPGGEAFALAGTATANKARRERSGTPIELITEAERAGGGKAIWAVVAPDSQRFACDRPRPLR